MSAMEQHNTVRTRDSHSCYLCGKSGKFIHKNIADKLFGVPGSWNFRQCPDKACGLIWLDPVPLSEDLPELYKNYYTHQQQTHKQSFLKSLYQRMTDGYLNRAYGYSSIGNSGFDQILQLLLYLHPERRAAVDASVMGIRAMTGGHLLEIGSGDGERLQRFAQLGWDAEGLDFDVAAVNNAKLKGLDVRLGDLSAQRYPADRFDIIVASHVIEHVPDPVALLSECRRILKTKGMLVFYTPNGKSRGHHQYTADWRGLEAPRHLHVFTPEALKTTALKAGFADVQCTTTQRNANVLLESYLLKKYGSIDKTAFPLQKRLLFEMFAILGFVSRIRNTDLGEELELKAIK